MKGVALLTLLLATAWGAQYEMECPFPEGQDVSSEAECALYSACEWSGDACYMQDNGVVGYTVLTAPAMTDRGFTVTAGVTDSTKTMFGGDVETVQLEVIYHEDYHVEVKITDAAAPRYEVPVPINLPESTGSAPMYTVEVAEVGNPLYFTITRTATGTEVFSTHGALTYENQFIQFTTHLASTYLYGFGENTHENLRHQFEPRNTWPIFTRDEEVVPGFINEYGAHPYYSVVEDDEGNTNSVFFFNSNAMEYSTFLLPDGSPALTLRTIGGIIDLHIFLGPTPEDVNMQYIEMIGFPEFPPYWALGFHLSRWGYNNTDHVRLVRDRMRAAGIPQDVQTCDIDYMDRYRDFTFDPVNWGDLPTLIDELHAENIKVTLPIDPAVVIDFENYPTVGRGRDVDAFMKWMSPDLIPTDQPEGTNDYMVGYVWPDTKTIFPDFLKNVTQEWWINEIRLFYEELKFDMIWLDMNEPANFGTNMDQPWNWPEGQDPWSLKCPVNQWDDPPYKTMMTRVGTIESDRMSEHTLCMTGVQEDGDYLLYDTKSIYGWAETKATYEALYYLFPKMRQAILTRSTFPSSGTFAFHWQGDNVAEWPLMKMSIVGMIEFNMFGIPMVGSDICGFYGTPDEEMCSRWMQLGAFYPFSRNHNAQGYPDQDPAANPTVAAISREVLLLRYKYLPYLYGLFHRGHMDGKTVVRPLYNVFPTDVPARDVDDQFLWGDFLMIAPVITQGAVSRDVYFPEALWYDLVTGELVSSSAGAQTVDAPLEKIPVYIRGGSIVPNQEPALTTTESRLNNFGLTIALDSAEYATGELYWDDGDKEHNMPETYMSLLNFTGGVISTEIRHGEDQVAGLSFDNVVFYGYPNNPASITVNGESLDVAAWTFDEVASILSVQIDALLEIPLSMILE